jgi:hypothetical protein
VGVARDLDELTSNRIRDIHDKIGKYSTSDWSLIGDIMKELANAGVTERTNKTIPSTRASHHGRPLRVWKSLVYGNRDTDMSPLIGVL